MNKTYDVNYSLEVIGGEFTRGGSICPPHPKNCAYLCFSHETYGVAVVPNSLWSASQLHEGISNMLTKHAFFCFPHSVFNILKATCGNKSDRGRPAR
jgi:hypothetical protein